MRRAFAALAITVARVALYLIRSPSMLFVLTLGTMLFRHPDVPGPPYDRLAFVALAFTVPLSVLAKQERPALFAPIAVPMLLLLALAAGSVVPRPYNAETWSLLANEYAVPYAMFFMAMAVFGDDRARRHFFVFAVVTAVYLIVTSLGTLLGPPFPVYPRFILDPRLGPPEQFGRARGPLLNAVSNGTAIILLSLFSLHWLKAAPRWRVLRGLLLAGIPAAILATMTRGVWLSFLAAAAICFFSGGQVKMRRAIVTLAVVSAVTLGAAAASTRTGAFLTSRIQDRDNVTFRLNLYRASIEMFREKPLLGWGLNQTPPLFAHYLGSYRDSVVVHNTYLEVLLEHGSVGLLLYGLIVAQLFGLGRRIPAAAVLDGPASIDRRFVVLWRAGLCAYLVNGLFVIMNYQFVNAVLFTAAGMIAAREADLARTCRGAGPREGR